MVESEAFYFAYILQNRVEIRRNRCTSRGLTPRSKCQCVAWSGISGPSNAIKSSTRETGFAIRGRPLRPLDNALQRHRAIIYGRARGASG
jgi:hypothetical protein